MKKNVFVGALILIFMTCSTVFAADYRVLVLPDSVASKSGIDSFIYEGSSEFFANQVINRLNLSGTIESPSVSEVREKLARNPRLYSSVNDSLTGFKKTYNINYMNLKKVSAMFGTNKVLLITSSADSQNYFMKRTFWDFLNIPGATVIDPSIKLSTYAVLIDTDRDVNLWEDTFYKTISACENRMIANQMGPQTQQLEKIRDYSRMLGPQIASNVQAHIVPASMTTRANIITYGPKDFDNVFTKKFRWYKHGVKEIRRESDNMYKDYRESQAERGIENIPQKCSRWKSEWKQRNADAKVKRAAKREERARIKQEKAKKELEAKQLKLQEIKNKQQKIQDVNNKVEEKTITKPSEEKLLNNILPTSTEEVQELPRKYYQPKTRVLENYNTTINDL